MEKCKVCGGTTGSRCPKTGAMIGTVLEEPSPIEAPLNEMLCSRCYNWAFDILER